MQSISSLKSTRFNFSCNFFVPFLEKLPFSVRVLLESAVRNCDNFQIFKKDVETILNWRETQSKSVEFPFRPARTILQDFTYVKFNLFLIEEKQLWNK